MSGRVTMEQIAERAGVSKYAVSKALSGQPGVSEQTRERVVAIATELGYFLQQRIQRKYQRNTQERSAQPAFDKRSVMVIMPNVRLQNLESQYWGRIVDGIATEVRSHELSIIIATEDSEESLSTVINVDGLLGLIVVGMISTSMIRQIHKMGVPYVMVDHVDPTVNCDTLLVNNFDGAMVLTNHLLDLGHERFQFIGDTQFARSFQDRWLGYRTALEQADVFFGQHEGLLRVSSLVNDSTTRVHLRQCLEDVLSEEHGPTAFVCANDDIAIAVEDTLRELGVRVPSDISVTGFDDIIRAAACAVPLTTMRIAKEELGERAVEMLIRRLGRPSAPSERVLLSTEFVCRTSTTTPLSNQGEKRVLASLIGRP